MSYPLCLLIIVFPKSCMDVRRNFPNETLTSGMYNVWISGIELSVYCKMDAGKKYLSDDRNDNHQITMWKVTQSTIWMKMYFSVSIVNYIKLISVHIKRKIRIRDDTSRAFINKDKNKIPRFVFLITFALSWSIVYQCTNKSNKLPG